MRFLIKMIIPPTEEITNADVANYLNEIIERYGPPCDFCKYFDVICAKGLRNRQYELSIGPFDHWNVRKKCTEFEGKDEEEDNNTETYIRRGLDCNVQTYCR